MEELQCYNKGCGVKFYPENNSEESCCYHPGEPIFHDAYKGWSCCNKRSTDFTTFLNTKGCSRGQHNSEKIIEPPKQKNESLEDELIIPEPSKPVVSFPRPDVNSILTRVSCTVTQSLTQALEKIHSKLKEDKDDDGDDTSEPRMGESCKNNACKMTYEGEGTDLDICKYHPGFPIFHEGMKYWSCCQKKTCDFDVFLSQEGCLAGSHLWKKKSVKQASCRHDWHQTGSSVYLTIYAKNCQPDFCTVDVNPIRLICDIVFGESCEFKLDMELDGIVEPSKCKVTLAPTKVEVCMKKGEPKTWSKLGEEMGEEEKIIKESEEEEVNLNEIEVHPSIDITNIDLSDI